MENDENMSYCIDLPIHSVSLSINNNFLPRYMIPKYLHSSYGHHLQRKYYPAGEAVKMITPIVGNLQGKQMFLFNDPPNKASKPLNNLRSSRLICKAACSIYQIIS